MVWYTWYHGIINLLSEIDRKAWICLMFEGLSGPQMLLPYEYTDLITVLHLRGFACCNKNEKDRIYC